MKKFLTVALFATVLILMVAGNPDDPLPLRVGVSALGGMAISTVYSALSESGHGPAIAAFVLCVGYTVLTLAAPNPSPVEMLLAFVVSPIIAYGVIRWDDRRG